MTHKLLLVAALLCPALSAAALPVALDRFIAGAASEAAAAQDSLQGTPSRPGVSSWFEALQLRQKTNSTINPFTSGAEPSYELRLTLKAWGQRAAEQEALGWRAQQHLAQEQAAKAQALRRRYDLVLALLAQHASTQAQLRSAALLESEVKLNRSLVAAREFNVKRLLDAEVAWAQALGQAEMGLVRVNELRAAMGLAPHTRASLVAEDPHNGLLTPRQMQDRVAHALDVQPTPAAQLLRLQSARLQAESVAAQARQRLGMAAVGVEHFNSVAGAGNNDKKTQVTLTLNIPLGGESFNTADSRFAARQAEADYQQRLAEEAHLLATLKRELNGLVQSWELAQAGRQKHAARLNNPAPKADPELLLALRQEEARQLKEIASLEQGTRTLYLQYLFASGMLTLQPVRSWLRDGTPTLSAD
jgi:hypothetical protein